MHRQRGASRSGERVKMAHQSTTPTTTPTTTTTTTTAVAVAKTTSTAAAAAAAKTASKPAASHAVTITGAKQKPTKRVKPSITTTNLPSSAAHPARVTAAETSRDKSPQTALVIPTVEAAEPRDDSSAASATARTTGSAAESGDGTPSTVNSANNTTTAADPPSTAPAPSPAPEIAVWTDRVNTLIDMFDLELDASVSGARLVRTRRCENLTTAASDSGEFQLDAVERRDSSGAETETEDLPPDPSDTADSAAAALNASEKKVRFSAVKKIHRAKLPPPPHEEESTASGVDKAVEAAKEEDQQGSRPTADKTTVPDIGNSKRSETASKPDRDDSTAREGKVCQPAPDTRQPLVQTDQNQHKRRAASACNLATPKSSPIVGILTTRRDSKTTVVGQREEVDVRRATRLNAKSPSLSLPDVVFKRDSVGELDTQRGAGVVERVTSSLADAWQWIGNAAAVIFDDWMLVGSVLFLLATIIFAFFID